MLLTCALTRDDIQIDLINKYAYLVDHILMFVKN